MLNQRPIGRQTGRHTEKETDSFTDKQRYMNTERHTTTCYIKTLWSTVAEKNDNNYNDFTKNQAGLDKSRTSASYVLKITNFTNYRT